MDPIVERIRSLTLEFLTPLTFEEAYKRITEEAMRLVEADYGLILLQQKKLQVVYASSPVLYKVKPIESRVIKLVFKNKKTVILSGKEELKQNDFAQIVAANSLIAVPLIDINKCAGVLILIFSKKENRLQERQKLIDLFASIASLFLKKTELEDQAKNALDSKDIFTAMASHELKTPLTAISGYAQLLQKRSSKEGSPEARWIELLSKETSRMIKIIWQLLWVDKIKKGKLEYSWDKCLLQDIFDKALFDFQLTHPQRTVVFKNRFKDKVGITIGDFDKLLQVVVNLLDNAAKFSAANTKIQATISFRGSRIVLRIQDWGRGIPQKDLSHIFQAYHKGDWDEKGMGIGLFLAKNIVEQHKGSINVRSEVNKGTKVEVRLPRFIEDIAIP